MESLAISPQAVAKAGDSIAIDSPTFYGILQLHDVLVMRAVEIPTRRKLMAQDITALEKPRDAAGAPPTPGRLPDWKGGR